MAQLDEILKGGDLRSIGNSNKIIPLINGQACFDNLFQYLFHSDRIVVMRTADIIEKITLNNAEYLKPHKKQILELLNSARNKELKWHLALLVPRVLLSKEEFGKVWKKLTSWATDNKESRIVRVNSLQGLFNLLNQSREFIKGFNLTLSEIEKENIPSINARIRRLKDANR